MNDSCTEYREMFDAFLDGELDEDGRRALEAHVEKCEACRAELELWRRTVRLVSEMPRRRAPRDFAERVLRQLRRREAPSPRPKIITFAWSRLLPVAAMFVLVFVLIFNVNRNGIFKTPGPSPMLARDMKQPAAKSARRKARARGDIVAGAAAMRREVAEVGHETMSAPAARQSEKLKTAEALSLPKRMLPARPAAALDDAIARMGRMKEEMTQMEGRLSYAEAPQSNEIVFEQVVRPRRLNAPPPHQVLELYGKEPADIIHRTIEKANELGISTALRLGNDRTVSVEMEVPPGQYNALLKKLSSLTGPERQTLSNTDIAQDRFFAQALDDYDAYRESAKKGASARDRLHPAEAEGGSFEMKAKAAAPASAPLSRARADKTRTFLANAPASSRTTSAPARSSRSAQTRTSPIRLRVTIHAAE